MDTERPIFAVTNFIDDSYPDGPSFIAYCHPRLEEWQRRNFDSEYFEKQIYPIMREIKVCVTTLETIHIYNMKEDEWFDLDNEWNGFHSRNIIDGIRDPDIKDKLLEMCSDYY